MPRISVVDLSHHNTIPSSLQPAANIGVLGVIHKATEATGYKDEKYESRRKLAADAKLLWGAYHFMRRDQIAVQVDWFMRFAAPDDNTLMACDYEDPQVPMAQLIEFMQRLEQKLGRSPVLYCGHVLKEKLGKTPNPALTGYRLWLAQYGNSPHPPAGWEKPWLWQYSDGTVGPAPHLVAGINPPVDCDYYEGTDDQLRLEWAGGQVQAAKAAPAPQEPAPAAPESVVKIVIEAPPGVRVEVKQI